MRTIEEQIFDRRCDAARDGREDDVRFYDELLDYVAENDEKTITNLGYEVNDLRHDLALREQDIANMEDTIADLRKQLD